MSNIHGVNAWRCDDVKKQQKFWKSNNFLSQFQLSVLVVLLPTMRKSVVESTITWEENCTVLVLFSQKQTVVLKHKFPHEDWQFLWSFFVVSQCVPWPLLRDVRRAEQLSPDLSPLVSPKEALCRLHAPTAALVEVKFKLQRYGDPTESQTNVKFVECVLLQGLQILPTSQLSRSYSEKGEASQRNFFSLSSDRYER